MRMVEEEGVSRTTAMFKYPTAQVDDCSGMNCRAAWSHFEDSWRRYFPYDAYWKATLTPIIDT